MSSRPASYLLKNKITFKSVTPELRYYANQPHFNKHYRMLTNRNI